MGQEWRQGPDGILRLVDTETGEVLSQQKTKSTKYTSATTGKRRIKGNRGPGRPVADPNITHHWVLDGNGRKHWMLKGTNPDTMPRVVHPYCTVTCEHICRFISEGKTLSLVARIEGMPPVHTIFAWQREYPEFRKQMKDARTARAEYFADKAIDTAEESKESRVQSDRLKTDTYKWAAEVNDRDTYGKQTKMSGEGLAQVLIQIVTGVPQAEEKPAIVAESREIKEKELA